MAGQLCSRIFSKANGTRSHLSVYMLADRSIEIEVQHEPEARSTEYVIDEGDELVLFVKIEGVAAGEPDGVIIDRPTLLPSTSFIIRDREGTRGLVEVTS